MRNHLTLLGLTLLGALLVGLAACEQGNDAVSPEPAASPDSGGTAVAGDDEVLSPEPTASPDSTETVAPDGRPVEFETIEKGGRSGTAEEEPHLFKIETQADWEEFWSRHRSNVVPTPPLPTVDFSPEMVIAVVDEQRPSGGYRFDITDIEASDPALIVHVRREIPGRHCAVTAVTTRPFYIVRLAQSDLEPQLEIRDSRRDCD